MNKTKRTTATTRKPKIRTAEAPNLDTGFWLLSRMGDVSVKDVLEKPYLYQVWVYSCVSTIINNIAALPKKLKDVSGGYKDNHQVLQLLKKPNNLMTEQMFWRTVLAYIMLPSDISSGLHNQEGGQCFIVPWDAQRDQKVDLRKEMPSELMVYPDKYFEPITTPISGGRKRFDGWRFGSRVADVGAIDFAPHEIIRVNMLNPYDMFKGLSPAGPIASALELDTKADIYNQNIFDNDGRLSGQVLSPQFIRDDDLEKIKKEWNKQYTGSKRSMTAFLTGGMKYEQFALSQSEMQYLEQAKWLRQKIIAAYRLNRIAVGDYEDINYATIREGRKMLWQDTYMPIDQLVLDAVNNQWINYIENDAYDLVSDYSQVPALQTDISERIKTGGVLCTQYAFPPALAARIMGIPLTKEDLVQWPHLNEPVQAAPAPGAVLFSSPATVKRAETDDDKRKRREAYSDAYITRVLDPHERAFRRDLDRYFIAQRNGILDNIDKWAKGKKAVVKVNGLSAIDMLYDIDEETQKLIGIYAPNAKAQAKAEKKQVEQDLKHGIQWDVTSDWIESAVDKRQSFMEEINTTTFNNARDAIETIVEAGVDEGLTVSELAKKIKQGVQDVYEVRLGKPVTPHGDFDLGGMSSSMTIARTEMGSIASEARISAYRKEGIEKTEWVTSKDDLVRESHRSIDGDIVSLGKEFPNGLRYPRDPQGDPSETINCRCVALAVTSEGEEG